MKIVFVITMLAITGCGREDNNETKGKLGFVRGATKKTLVSIFKTDSFAEIKKLLSQLRGKIEKTLLSISETRSSAEIERLAEQLRDQVDEMRGLYIQKSTLVTDSSDGWSSDYLKVHMEYNSWAAEMGVSMSKIQIEKKALLRDNHTATTIFAKIEAVLERMFDATPAPQLGRSMTTSKATRTTNKKIDATITAMLLGGG